LVAKDTEAKGLSEDAVRLYDLAKVYIDIYISSGFELGS
jgi:hypothetical protein